MMLAKVRAYAPTTHCRAATPACRLVWTLAERHAHHGVVQEGQEQQRAQRGERHPLAAAGHRPLVAGHGPGRAGQPSGPASAGRAARGGHRAAGYQLEQAAQAGVPDLPGPVLVHRRALLPAQQGGAAGHDVVGHGRAGAGRHRHGGDLGPDPAGQGQLAERGDGRGEDGPVLQQGGPLRGRGAGVEELLPVRGDLCHGFRAGLRRRGRGRTLTCLTTSWNCRRQPVPRAPGPAPEPGMIRRATSGYRIARP